MEGATLRKIVLYIAMSLDGYIADEAGGVDWLGGQEPEANGYDSFAEFVPGVDTVVMGWNTYRQVREELAQDEWPYAGLACYVLTHRKPPEDENVQFVAEPAGDLLRRLRELPGRDIWICGGAAVVQQLMQADLIDRWHIAVVPQLLGSGLPLFAQQPTGQALRLLHTLSYNGIVELIYERR